MTTEFVKIESLPVDEIKFSKTKNQKGKRFINVFFNKKTLSLKFPSLRIPFNTKINQFGQLELNLSLDKNESLIEKIKKIDEKMKNSCKDEDWFEDCSKCLYTPMLKESVGGAYPPTVKLKIPYKDYNSREIKTTFYDKDKQKMSIKTSEDVSEVLTQGTKVQTAAECVGVWFMGNKYGLTWKTEQVRITEKNEFRKKEIQEDYAFCSDSEDESQSDTELLISDDDE